MFQDWLAGYEYSDDHGEDHDGIHVEDGYDKWSQPYSESGQSEYDPTRDNLEENINP